MQIILYLSIVTATVSQSWSGKAFNKNGGASHIFNALKAGAALVMFGIMSVFGFSLRTEAMVFGALYGISLSVSMHAGYRALALGPMSLTSMLTSLSVIIPVVWGVAVRAEELGTFKYMAFAALIFALFMTNADRLKRDKNRKGEGTDYLKWILCVALVFITNGLCSVLQKEYRMALPDGESDEFMLYAMLVCSLIYIPICLHRARKDGVKLEKNMWLGVFAGCMMGLSSFLTLILAAFANASVMFPVISAATLLGALLCGRVVFRERLRVNHYIAMLAGILAVVFLKI